MVPSTGDVSATGTSGLIVQSPPRARTMGLALTKGLLSARSLELSKGLTPRCCSSNVVSSGSVPWLTNVSGAGGVSMELSIRRRLDRRTISVPEAGRSRCSRCSGPWPSRAKVKAAAGAERLSASMALITSLPVWASSPHRTTSGGESSIVYRISITRQRRRRQPGLRRPRLPAGD